MILSLAVLSRIASLCPSGARRDLEDGVRAARSIAHLASPAPVALRLGFAPKLRVLVHPGKPSHHQALYKLCAVNGYRIVSEPAAPYEVAFHFEYMGGECRLPQDAPVVNRALLDVSKRRVQEVFESVFGYPLAVDPLVHEGPLVEKSNGNYTHDGRILQGPLASEDVHPDRVYQRLVNAVADGVAVDFRVPLYGGRAPLVYDKRRPLAARFANENTSAELREPSEVFDADEIDALGRFAAAMGLDYGEVDVLRDVDDGRIYVVDVNNRPAGPPAALSVGNAAEALRRLKPAFAALVESFLKGPAPGARERPRSA